MSHPITFKQITFKNFLSYGNIETVVNFDHKGTTLINGVDLDNTANGKTSNGVGKTSVFNALVYALYDEAISDISKDKLINNINNKDLKVTCTFVKNNAEYTIERVRKGKGGTYVKFTKGEENLTRDSSDNTNKLIEATIGMPYSIFIIAVVFTASKRPFLELKTSEQTEIIEHLNGLTEVSNRAEVLKEQMKETNAELKQEEFKIEMLKKEHTRYKEQAALIQKRIDTWNIEHEKRLISLKEEKETLGQIDFEQEIQNHTMLEEYVRRYTSTEAELKRAEKEMKELMTDHKNVTEDIQHLENHECPYCKQHYDDVKEKIKEKREDLELIERGLLVYNQQITDLRCVSDDMSQKATNIKKKVVTTSLAEARKLQLQASQLDQKIETEEKATNPHEGMMADFEGVTLDPINYEKINQITKLIEHQKFLQKILTKKDSFVRKVLLDKNLPYLNNRLQQYLLDMGLRHKVEFTAELTTEISLRGRSLDFGNLSTGQRARVNIALAMSFRDLLQKLHDPVNVCLFDEVLDVGLDSVGVQLAAKLIKKRAKEEGSTLYIISHREEVDGMFDRVMTVEFENRFSTIRDA